MTHSQIQQAAEREYPFMETDYIVHIDAQKNRREHFIAGAEWYAQQVTAALAEQKDHKMRSPITGKDMTETVAYEDGIPSIHWKDEDNGELFDTPAQLDMNLAVYKALKNKTDETNH